MLPPAETLDIVALVAHTGRPLADRELADRPGLADATDEHRRGSSAVAHSQRVVADGWRVVYTGRRAEALPYAALLLGGLMEAGQPKEVVFSSFGLREGFLYDRLPAIERSKDPLLMAAVDFAQREGRFPDLGDDLVDFAIMKEIGIPTCPIDAVPEIKAISQYVSDRKGGEGCVRDVIEQVMRSQQKWFGQEIIRAGV